MRRVAVITEIMSPYRTPVFNLLARCPGIDLHVMFLRENVRERSWRVRREDMRFRYTVLPGWYAARGGRASPVYLNRGVGRVLGGFAPHVVITGGYHHWASAAALRYARARCDLVLWCESTLADRRPSSRLLQRYKRRYVGSCDRFLVPGTASREFLVSLGAPPDRIWVAPNAVDDGLFGSVERRGTGAFTVLYMGRLIAHKRVGDLIEAFAPLDPSGARLLIVGDGPEEAELMRQVRRRGLRGVEFAGFVQPSSLPGIYARSDVLVLPSESEPWGLVVNEAMAAGLPVLASRAAGAARDLIVEGVNGRTFAPGDVAALRRFLGGLRDDPDARRRMGERGRALAAWCTAERAARGFAEVAHGSPNDVYREFLRSREALARAAVVQ